MRTASVENLVLNLWIACGSTGDKGVIWLGTLALLHLGGTGWEQPDGLNGFTPIVDAYHTRCYWLPAPSASLVPKSAFSKLVVCVPRHSRIVFWKKILFGTWVTPSWTPDADIS